MTLTVLSGLSRESRGLTKNLQKAISSCFRSFCQFVRCYVGEGFDDYFWEDTWVSDKPLCILFPHLYFLSEKRLHSLASVLPSTDPVSSISLSFRRPLSDRR